MKLVCWVADELTDRSSYSIRARTRRECKALRAAQGKYADDCAAPRKIVVEYKDAFDLISKALGEGGVEWRST